MEFEDQEEEQDADLGLPPSYDDSLTLTRTPKMPTPPSEPPPLRKWRYKECLKNHAVGIGGHAVDGCGEFIPAGEDGTLESLKCAACTCHRNFHRKESELPAAAAGGGGGGYFAFPQQQQQLLLAHHPFGYRPPSGYLHVAAARPPMLALPSSSGGSGSRDEAEDYFSNPSSSGGGGGGKKRFRTKFTQEQKDKMLSFAERVGWRIQRQDEEMVQHFCVEVGIKRHVLKVWMHNNKHTLGKKT